MESKGYFSRKNSTESKGGLELQTSIARSRNAEDHADFSMTENALIFPEMIKPDA